MTYEYLDTVTGETRTVQQRITDAPFTHYNPTVGEWERARDGVRLSCRYHAVKRLISGAPTFALIPGAAGGWASEGYSQPLNFRKAEAKLGHRVHRKL